MQKAGAGDNKVRNSAFWHYQPRLKRNCKIFTGFFPAVVVDPNKLNKIIVPNITNEPAMTAKLVFACFACFLGAFCFFICVLQKF